jgi:predicted acylesterase/phospholipase RssA
MNIDIENLFSPVRAVRPRDEQILELSRALGRKGDLAGARRVLDDARIILPSTATLISALAMATMRDPGLTFPIRASAALKMLSDFSLSHPSDVTVLRTRGTILLEIADRTGSFADIDQAYLAHVSLLGCAPDIDALHAALECLYLSDRIALCKVENAQNLGLGPRLKDLDCDRIDCLRRIQHLMACAAPATGRNCDLDQLLRQILAYGYLGEWQSAENIVKDLRFDDPANSPAIFNAVKKLFFRTLASADTLQHNKESHAPLFPRRLALSIAALVSNDPERYFETVGASLRLGKIGLALSGGGLRAAFFHIGTLAALAERDLLRLVSVLSTVSGGSIVGAQYYLELRRLYLRKREGDVTREDFIEIVRMSRVFSAATRKNIRMRAFGDYRHAINGIFKAQFNRSILAAELYDRFLYTQYFDKDKMFRPSLLELSYFGKARYSDLETANLFRVAKVPELILNSTVLNDGDTFSFSANWAKKGTNKPILNSEFLAAVPLGFAVAASSCVPGLFDPIALERVLPESLIRQIVEWHERRSRLTEELEHFVKNYSNPWQSPEVIRALLHARERRQSDELDPILQIVDLDLVDGGVYDNQGLEALITTGCTTVICSDGAAPFDSRVGGSTALRAALRTNNILMKRVRDLLVKFTNVSPRIHKQGAYFVQIGDLPNVNIDPVLAKRLAHICTDLDSFTEVEAASLMAGGYLAANSIFADWVINPYNEGSDKTARGQSEVDWSFRPIIKWLEHSESANPVVSRRLGTHLRAARYRLIRPFLLSKWHLLWFPACLAAVLTVPTQHLRISWILQISSDFLRHVWESSLPIISIAIWVIAIIFLFVWRFGEYDEYIERAMVHLLSPRNWIRSISYSVISLVTIPMRLFWLSVVDPLLQWSGSLKHVLNKAPTPAERALSGITALAMVWPTVLGITFFVSWATSTADGRSKLPFDIWSVSKCIRDVHENKLQRGNLRVSLVDWNVVDAFCQRKWVGETLVLLHKYSLAIESTKESAGVNSLTSGIAGANRRKVEDFLRDNGAEEFLAFLEIFEYIPLLYDAHLGATDWKAGLPLRVREAVELAASNINWSALISSEGDSALAVSVDLQDGRKLVLIRQGSPAVTIAEFAVWVKKFDRTASGSINARAIHSWAATELAGIFEELDHRYRNSQSGRYDANRVWSAQETNTSSRRPFEVVLSHGDFANLCEAPHRLEDRVTLCANDDRIFISYFGMDAFRSVIPVGARKAIAEILLRVE